MLMILVSLLLYCFFVFMLIYGYRKAWPSVVIQMQQVDPTWSDTFMICFANIFAVALIAGVICGPFHILDGSLLRGLRMAEG